jgi:hypothetical protein
MADMNRVSFAICIRLPPVRHSTHNNAITVSVSLLLTQTAHSSTKGMLVAGKTLEQHLNEV